MLGNFSMKYCAKDYVDKNFLEIENSKNLINPTECFEQILKTFSHSKYLFEKNPINIIKIVGRRFL